MTKVKLITNYFDMLPADEIVVTDASFVSDDVMELRYENKENFIEPNAKTNVVIAAFTTAHARLKLYSNLEQLGERVLYYDTDSVIYVSKPGEMEAETGVYLGELTDELDGNSGGLRAGPPGPGPWAPHIWGLPHFQVLVNFSKICVDDNAIFTWIHLTMAVQRSLKWVQEIPFASMHSSQSLTYWRVNLKRAQMHMPR